MTRARRPRQVDWPKVTGRDLGSPRTLPASSAGVSVLAAADELASYRDLDLVLRRAVELSRDRIGLERVALFLYDASGEKRCGSLRIERFFTLVSPDGGNLLQAALDAGFGSYAQFHRVFRELWGRRRANT